MALLPGRPLNDHCHRHAKLPVTAPSHKPSSGYNIPASEKSDEFLLCPIQENANYLQSLFPKEEKMIRDSIHDSATYQRSGIELKRGGRRSVINKKEIIRTPTILGAQTGAWNRQRSQRSKEKTSRTSTTVITVTTPSE